MKELVALVKIESMSSLEIAELTGKRHLHVLRDIRNMLKELKDNPELDSEYKSCTYIAKNGKEEKLYHLNKALTWTLVTGYSIDLRKKVIDRWQYLEEQLEIVKARTGSKKHQLSAMEALHDFLPDDLQDEAVSYIKANTVVNKATSNLFGFPKMLKKDEMSQAMLVMREKILDDYLALFGVLEDNSKVKELLYGKY
jgi:phage regulator Rha-like protein